MTQEEFYAQWEKGAGLTAFTSGSTGKPKEIRLSRALVEASASATNRFFGLTKDSRLHVSLDFEYIAAKMMAVRAELAGARLTSEKPSNRPLEGIHATEVIDLLAVVPSQMGHILDRMAGSSGADSLPDIRAIIIGGGVIPQGLKDRIVESGLNAWETYGMTETASHIALRRVGDVWFQTLPDVSVSVDADDCLVIHRSGFPSVHTHDVAELKDSHRFRILGRIDNVINTGGKKVFAEELEKELAGIWAETGVDFEFAITSAPDEKWGERIVAVIATGSAVGSVGPGEGSAPPGEGYELAGEGYEDVKDLSDSQLLDLARRHLAPHRVPKEIRRVSSLPRTQSGKIKRSELR